MTTNMARFSPVARRLLSYTQETAEEFQSEFITSEHMLLAMTVQEDADAFLVLDEFDIIESKLRPFVKTFFAKNKPFVKPKHPLDPHMDLADSIKATLQLGVDSATSQGFYIIGTGSLLIGIMRLDSENIDAILEHFNVQRKDIIKQAEYYMTKGDTLEQQAQKEYFDELNRTQSLGCFDTIRNMIGLNDDR